MISLYLSDRSNFSHSTLSMRCDLVSSVHIFPRNHEPPCNLFWPDVLLCGGWMIALPCFPGGVCPGGIAKMCAGRCI